MGLPAGPKFCRPEVLQARSSAGQKFKPFKSHIPPIQPKDPPRPSSKGKRCFPFVEWKATSQDDDQRVLKKETVVEGEMMAFLHLCSGCGQHRVKEITNKAPWNIMSVPSRRLALPTCTTGFMPLDSGSQHPYSVRCSHPSHGWSLRISSPWWRPADPSSKSRAVITPTMPGALQTPAEGPVSATGDDESMRVSAQSLSCSGNQAPLLRVKMHQRLLIGSSV